MATRPPRFWMRWYVVRAVRGGWSGTEPVEDDEWVECATLTRWGAWRAIAGDEMLYAVRRTVWEREHD